MSAWDDVVDRLKERFDRRGSVRRFRVVGTDPLIVRALDGDERLEQGDEDVEIDDGTLAAAEVGDVVLVFEDDEGDFVIAGLLGDEESPKGISSTALAKLAAIGDHCVLNRATGLAVPISTLTTITWDFERDDPGGWHAPGATGIIVPEPGDYAAEIQLSWDASGSGIRYHHLEIDALDDVARIVAAKRLVAGDETTGNMIWGGFLEADTALRVVVYNSGGGGTRFFGGSGSGGGSGYNRRPASDGISANAEFAVTRRG